MKPYKSLLLLLLSVTVGLILLYAYNEKRIQADDFALGKENTTRSETWNGTPFTGHKISDIVPLIRQYSILQANHALDEKKIIAWYGNSQLHTLNQFKIGQHLAPYWLRKLAPCPDCLVPLGLSQSNANPQEELVLSEYVAKRLPVRAVVLEVEFMGFREAGLRDEFSEIASPDLVKDLSAYPVAQDLQVLVNRKAKKNGNGTGNLGLDSNLQQNTEAFLSKKLSEIWPLWRDRVNLNTNLLTDLFAFRNWALNIKSENIRKLIKPRYDKNMRALEDMLAHYHKANIPVVMYFAPVRQDKPLPYIREEYEEWKRQVERLAKTYDASCINLEKLVPPQDWGSNFGEDIDFMHFQEPGHRMVANALYPIIQAKIR